MKYNPLIVALDVESARQARELVRRIGPRADFYKVGLELYAAAGMDFVRELRDRGKNVFLDLKFYDIGETVKRAVAAVARADAQFLTVHASSAIVRAAVEGRGDSRIKVVAVTVLSSLNQQDLADEGYQCSLSDLVELRVRKAMDAGADGVVASALEARAIRQMASGAVIVTPGVRSAGAAKGDQKRIAAPAEAIQNGADYLIVGRQVTKAPDPAGAIEEILKEIEPVPVT